MGNRWNVKTYGKALAGRPNQDQCCSAASGQYMVITLADGVSSCSMAREGARIACEALTNLFLKNSRYFLNCSREQTANFALAHVLCELRRASEKSGIPLKEYASTLVSVLYDRKNGRLLYFSLGDSMILASGSGHCGVLAMPSDSRRGCCVTTTKHAGQMVKTDVVDGAGLDILLLCSDGAWKELFAGNRMKPETIAALLNHDPEALQDYLERQESTDDCSFAAMNLAQARQSVYTQACRV